MSRGARRDGAERTVLDLLLPPAGRSAGDGELDLSSPSSPRWQDPDHGPELQLALRLHLFGTPRPEGHP